MIKCYKDTMILRDSFQGQIYLLCIFIREFYVSSSRHLQISRLTLMNKMDLIRHWIQWPPYWNLWWIFSCNFFI